jgi:hypothetical protein
MDVNKQIVSLAAKVTSEYQACLDSKANYRLKMAMVPSQPEIGDSTAKVFVTRPDKAAA